MATLTEVSPYRMGPPRFGTKPYVFDNSVKTYQLTPEQLERLRAGEKLDDILKEAKEMEQQKPKVIAYAKQNGICYIDVKMAKLSIAMSRCKSAS